VSLARAYVGLGSNLGDRMGALREALRRLAEAPGVESVRCSPVYETDPVGFTDQPPFLNACAEVATSLGPEELLATCLAIESAMGRERAERWGPRVVDLDLLLYEDLEVRTEALTLPHPRITDRAFVLVPLMDLDPDLRVLPGTGPVREALDRLGRAGVRFHSASPIPEE